MIHVTRDRRERIEGYFERFVKDLLRRAFIRHDFFALSETAKYKPSESLDTWQQMKGERAEIVEIYHKGNWLCDVTSRMTRDQIINKVWKILQLKVVRGKKQNVGANDSAAG